MFYGVVYKSETSSGTSYLITRMWRGTEVVKQGRHPLNALFRIGQCAGGVQEPPVDRRKSLLINAPECELAQNIIIR